MRDLDHLSDLLPDVAVVARDEPADVDHHVQLTRAVLQSKTGLEDLRLSPRGPVRKSDDSPDRNGAACQQIASAFDVARPRANGSDVVLHCKHASGLDRCVIELRLQERVIDRLGDVAVAELFEKRAHPSLLTTFVPWRSTTKSTSRA